MSCRIYYIIEKKHMIHIWIIGALVLISFQIFYKWMFKKLNNMKFWIDFSSNEYEFQMKKTITFLFRTILTFLLLFIMHLFKYFKEKNFSVSNNNFSAAFFLLIQVHNKWYHYRHDYSKTHEKRFKHIRNKYSSCLWNRTQYHSWTYL